VDPPECELEDHGEEARLTGRGTAGRHSVDAPWDESSEEENSSGSDSGKRPGDHRQLGERKHAGREGGDLRDRAGQQFPSAERARHAVV